MQVFVDQAQERWGDVSEWVGAFAHLWAGGAASREGLVALLGPGIRLAAPGLRATHGREAADLAFRRTFALLPDLRGQVLRWSASGDALFIEMAFRASIGGRQVAWRNVDRILFRDGLAVERVAFYDTSRLWRAFLGHPAGWLHLLRRLRSGL